MSDVSSESLSSVEIKTLVENRSMLLGYLLNAMENYLQSDYCSSRSREEILVWFEEKVALYRRLAEPS